MGTGDTVVSIPNYVISLYIGEKGTCLNDSRGRGQLGQGPDSASLLYLLAGRAPCCLESLYILAEGASKAGVWGVTGRWGHIDSECTHVGSQLAE